MTGHTPWSQIKHKALKDAPAAQGDPHVIRSGNDVTILAPVAEVAIDFNPKETD